jgi:uncharacterized membrane protein
VASFPDRLSRELDRWVSDGLVTAEQADAIRARYAGTASLERRGRLISVVALVGAIVVGLGVILFFAANWDGIPRVARLLLLLAALVGAYGAGDRLRAARPLVAHAFVVLGVLLFGASVFLVGQMYNVSTHDPLAFLLWTAAAAAVGLVWRSSVLATLAIVLLAAWQADELFFTLPDSTAGSAVGPLAVLYGTALYAAGTAFAERLRPLGYTTPMRRLGLLFASVPLFVLSFDSVARELDDHDPFGHAEPVAFGLALAAATLAGAVVLARTRRWEALLLPVVAALGVLPALVDVHRGVYVVAFGLLALGALAAGVGAEEEWLVNVGVVFVGVELLARFFDLFGRMLPRSGAFVFTGVLLLALAWALERGRSHLMARIRT